MSLFVSSLFTLVLFCIILKWITKTSDDVGVKTESAAEFKTLQRSYMCIYLLAAAADWLQGPHVYALYQSYGFSTKQIGQLFVGGFGSSMIFGTCIGSLADKYGRRFNCLMYAIFYGFGCITKHYANFTILLVGRVMAGIATSILFSAFESWVICEHANKQLSEHSLGTLFANAVFGNSIVAVLSGIVAQFAANYFGLVAPFDVALIFLCLMGGIMMLTWSENFGNKKSNLVMSFKEAVVVLKTDKKVLCLGLIQSLFEGAMYTFVLEWTPAITPDNTMGDGIPHGLIFSAFMVSIMIGSAFFKILSDITKVESFMRFVFFTSTFSLMAPIFFEKGHLANYFSFLVFECNVGMFWPAMATLRGKYVPEETRATIMNIFRVPLNLIVIVVLLQDLELRNIFVLCVVFLALCFFTQVIFYRICQVENMENQRTSEVEIRRKEILLHSGVC